jgi:hypothetical protein
MAKHIEEIFIGPCPIKRRLAFTLWYLGNDLQRASLSNGHSPWFPVELLYEKL